MRLQKNGYAFDVPHRFWINHVINQQSKEILAKLLLFSLPSIAYVTITNKSCMNFTSILLNEKTRCFDLAHVNRAKCSKKQNEFPEIETSVGDKTMNLIALD